MTDIKSKDLMREIFYQTEAYEAGNKEARLKLLDLCKNLAAALETPSETFLRLNWRDVNCD
jgi:hypothetical protein